MLTRVYNPYNDLERALNPMKTQTQAYISNLQRGIVVRNDDPINCGRIKVRVPAVHGSAESGLSDEDLPWALYCSPSGSYNSGQFIIPEENDTVWVMFEDNNIYKPVYIGSCYGGGVNSVQLTGATKSNKVGKVAGVPTVPNESYGGTRKIIYKSPKGAIVYIDDAPTQESVVLQDHKGQSFVMSSKGGDSSSILTLVNGNAVSIESTEGNTTFKVDLGTAIFEFTNEGEGAVSIITGKNHIKMDDETTSIAQEGASIEIQDKKITIKREERVITVADDIDIESKDSSIKVGTDIDLKSKGTEIKLQDSVCTVKSDSVTNVNAERINLNAGYIYLGGDTNLDTGGD